MKRLTTLILGLILLTALGAQAQINSSVGEAKSQEQLTLDRLLQQAQAGTRNADLYYNIGVACYQTGKPGQAVLYFLRALNLDSAHRQARENLSFIYSLFPDEHKAPPQPFLVQLFFNIYAFFSLNRLALFVLCLGLLCTLSLHWLLHYPPERERGFPLLVLLIAVALFLAFTGALLFKNYRYRHDPRAVVIQEGAEGYATAESNRAIFILPEGYTVSIQKAGPKRTQVILPDGNRGWLATAQIERVLPQKQTKKGGSDEARNLRHP